MKNAFPAIVTLSLMIALPWLYWSGRTQLPPLSFALEGLVFVEKTPYALLTAMCRGVGTHYAMPEKENAGRFTLEKISLDPPAAVISYEKKRQELPLEKYSLERKGWSFSGFLKNETSVNFSGSAADFLAENVLIRCGQPVYFSQGLYGNRQVINSDTATKQKLLDNARRTMIELRMTQSVFVVLEKRDCVWQPDTCDVTVNPAAIYFRGTVELDGRRYLKLFAEDWDCGFHPILAREGDPIGQFTVSSIGEKQFTLSENGKTLEIEFSRYQMPQDQVCSYSDPDRVFSDAETFGNRFSDTKGAEIPVYAVSEILSEPLAVDMALKPFTARLKELAAAKGWKIKVEQDCILVWK
ncbi:MAG: hypothetical protein PHW04_18885 [Candidatus Wallbacteria bacterium]|nr:hypothetical protein [Candidatus Wallbacteria bacterium]